MATFAQRLRARRNNIGWTQEDLAAKSGFSVSSITAWERAINPPTGSSLARLADALQCSPAWLLSGVADVRPPPNVAEDAPTFRSRPDRLLERIAQLTDMEWARIEGALLTMVDAVIASRPGVNSGARDPMEELADEMVRADLAAVRGARGPSAPPRATTHARPMPGTTGGAPPTRDAPPHQARPN